VAAAKGADQLAAAGDAASASESKAGLTASAGERVVEIQLQAEAWGQSHIPIYVQLQAEAGGQSHMSIYVYQPSSPAACQF
jgi:hypothetical protein